MGLIIILLWLSGISVFGFDDFTYDGIIYDNPAKDMALGLGGRVVKVDWNAVENLQLEGPGLGIGLDTSRERAYINGSASDLHSLAADGPDAGDYECGHLYGRLLETEPCSLFVHIPSDPAIYDLAIVGQATIRIYFCHLTRRASCLHAKKWNY